MKYRFYMLEIELLGIEPAIWRSFVVPASITLAQLHEVIQMVMGWRDCHSYRFHIGHQRYTRWPALGEDGLPSKDYHLDELVDEEGAAFGYLYDFGDGWEHQLFLEEIFYMDPGASDELVCIDGARACPPENIGGALGYLEFLDVVSDPSNDEYESTIEWLGGTFDSERFDIDELNRQLKIYVHYFRERHKELYGTNEEE